MHQSAASHKRTFVELARAASQALGSPWGFALACGTVLAWAVTGPIFTFSDAWQLVINTGTTIVTFLMVFLIQNTQNRDARALHLKLDELIRSTRSARNRLIDLENCTDEELDAVQAEFDQVKQRIGEVRAGRSAVGGPHTRMSHAGRP